MSTRCPYAGESVPGHVCFSGEQGFCRCGTERCSRHGATLAAQPCPPAAALGPRHRAEPRQTRVTSHRVPLCDTSCSCWPGVCGSEGEEVWAVGDRVRVAHTTALVPVLPPSALQPLPHGTSGSLRTPSKNKHSVFPNTFLSCCGIFVEGRGREKQLKTIEGEDLSLWLFVMGFPPLLDMALTVLFLLKSLRIGGSTICR